MFNIFFDNNTWKGHVSAWPLISWKQLTRPWPRKWCGEIREIRSRWLGGKDSTEDVDQEEPYRGLWDFMKAWSWGQKWVDSRWGRWRDPEASLVASLAFQSQFLTFSLLHPIHMFLVAHFHRSSALSIHLTGPIWKKWKWLLGRLLSIQIWNQGPAVQGWYKMFGWTSGKNNVWILFGSGVCHGCG